MPVLGSLPAQQATFEVARADGTFLLATEVQTRDGNTFVLRTAAGTVELRAPDLLGIHGGAVVATGLPSFCLGGGDILRGNLVGGDTNGEWVEVLSPSLGTLKVTVDRIASVLFRPDQARLQDLRLPEGVGEALFQKATIGFDIIAGSIHRFGEPGVLFAPANKDKPIWFKTQELVGLRVASPSGPKTVANVEMVTRAGDRVSGKLVKWQGGTVTFTGEEHNEVTLNQTDVACITLLAPGAIFLSTQKVVKAEESGFEGEVLYPFQNDSNVLGAALVAGGRTYGRGFGVHSRSRLTFVVPDGVQSFSTRVAVDDSALELLPRADVEVTVLVEDRQAFHGTLRAGQPPQATGLIPVRPGQHLVLDVDFGKGRELGDRIDWLSPVFATAQRRE